MKSAIAAYREGWRASASPPGRPLQQRSARGRASGGVGRLSRIGGHTQSEGARPLNPHRQVADRPIANGADCDEYESGYEDADGYTCRLSHRIDLTASRTE